MGSSGLHGGRILDAVRTADPQAQLLPNSKSPLRASQSSVVSNASQKLQPGKQALLLLLNKALFRVSRCFL